MGMVALVAFGFVAGIVAVVVSDRWPVESQRPVGSTRARHVIAGCLMAGVLPLLTMTIPYAPYMVLMFGFSWLLLVLALIDWRSFRLPRRLTNAGFVVGLIVLAGCSWNVDQWDRLTWAIAMAAMAGGIAFVMHLLGAGFGDVHASALIGLYLGWWSPTAVFTALLVAWAALVVVHGVRRLAGRESKGQMIALGPFLAAGAVAPFLLA